MFNKWVLTAKGNFPNWGGLHSPLPRKLFGYYFIRDMKYMKVGALGSITFLTVELRGETSYLLQCLTDLVCKPFQRHSKKQLHCSHAPPHPRLLKHSSTLAAQSNFHIASYSELPCSSNMLLTHVHTHTHSYLFTHTQQKVINPRCYKWKNFYKML